MSLEVMLLVLLNNYTKNIQITWFQSSDLIGQECRYNGLFISILNLNVLG